MLERFTRRAPENFGDPQGKNVWYSGNTYVKTIANPRRVNFIGNAHFANCFEGVHSVNENAEPTTVNGHNCPVLANKIVINHYREKSHEEFIEKANRGRADGNSPVDLDAFDVHANNEVFDDGILRYRAERAQNFKLPDKSHADERLLNALMTNLSPTLVPTTPPDFYAGKMETFLTCRAVAAYLQTRLTDAALAKFFEEAALKAMLRSFAGMSFADVRLFLRELPSLLNLPYPVVNDLRGAAVQILPQLKDTMRVNSLWREFVELDYLLELLKTKE